MKLKYSTKVYLESRVDPKYKNIDLSKIEKNKKEKYYTQKNIPIKLSFTYERKRLEQYHTVINPESVVLHYKINSK